MTSCDRVQVSPDRRTVWVFGLDGSTVGRFSKMFGMDVHTTTSEQLAGAPECLHCTHEPPGPQEWAKFCSLIEEHYGVIVDKRAINFEADAHEDARMRKWAAAMRRCSAA